MRLLASGRMGHDTARAIIDAHQPPSASSPIGSEEDIFAPKRLPHLALLEPKFREVGKKFQELVDPFFSWVPALKPLNPDLVKEAVSPYGRVIWNSRIFTNRQADELRNCRVESGDAVLYEDMGVARSNYVAHIELFGHEAVASALTKSSLISRMEGLTPWIRETLVRSLTQACIVMLTTNLPVSFYVPFFRMWLEGNWPLGISKENELLLLIAD